MHFWIEVELIVFWTEKVLLVKRVEITFLEISYDKRVP